MKLSFVPVPGRAQQPSALGAVLNLDARAGTHGGNELDCRPALRVAAFSSPANIGRS
jgi:hypothetical protein